MRALLLLLSFVAAVVLAGCSGGEVSTSDIQANMKAMNKAAQRDPGTGGARD